MSDIREVALAAGVSTSTVSRVLSGHIPVSESTRSKVMKAVKMLNYRPNIIAQGLKGQSIRTIALIVPNVHNLVFPAAIKGIEDTARKLGYTLVLCNTDEECEREAIYIENLRRRLIDGFIISTFKRNQPYLKELLDDQYPAVFLIRQPIGCEGAHAVVLDNEAGGYLATKYLLDKGHRRIAFINGDLEVSLYAQRFAGYRRALEEAKTALDERLIIHGNEAWNESYQSMRRLLIQGYAPDAVFATSDPKAIGVARAIKDQGFSIPQDISLVGFDNSDIAHFMDPPLTTIAQPFYEMGSHACEKLVDLIEKKHSSDPKMETFPVKLIVRDSVR